VLAVTTTARGLNVAVACLPSSPSVTGTVTAAIPGAKAVPFRCSVAGRGTALVPGTVTRGRRVAVRLTALDLAGLPHVSAVTLAAR
jgi:hypothetical protein